MTRQFEIKPAVREGVPLLVGLFGTSGSGKTFSALRLATGIQSVKGGKIFVIDTEARRALHYAPKAGEKAEPERGKFDFQHLEFGEPFSSLDYLAAIRHCVDQGAGIIVIDSLSHEHEGPGGFLESHEKQVITLAGGEDAPQWKKEAVKIGAWAKPKAERQRLINTMLQLPCSFILCFRAKEKIKLASKAEKEAAKERGEKIESVKQMGFMPIGDPAFIFEMMVSCLLYPGSGGVPTWDSNEPGEKQMTKLPQQFMPIFSQSRPLDEEIGAEMARWAAGESVGPFSQFLESINGATKLEALEALVPKLQELKDKRIVPPAEYKALQAAYGQRVKLLKSPAEDYGDDIAPREPGDDSDMEGAA